MLLFCFITDARIFAQHSIGVPRIINFDYEKLNIGAQSWMISQEKSGKMYFANSDGLIVYNGAQWNAYPLPNRTLVRSLYISKDGKIYIGGQNEFGYFFPSPNGTLVFHSLKYLFPSSEQNISDVWNIMMYENQLFIRCSEKIYRIGPDKKVSVYPAVSEWSYMGVADGKLFIQDQKSGLFKWQRNQWVKISEELNNQLLTSVMDLGNHRILLTTYKKGMYVLNNEKDITPFPLSENIVRSQIYTAIKINDNQFALGTVSNGIFIINENGNILRQLSGNNGLQNNHIISMFLDEQSNLWLGLDKGIDLINNNNAIQTIAPTQQTPSACYSTKVFNNKLYIGTSNGLYSAPITIPQSEDLSLSEEGFEKVNNSNGQVWGLDILNNELFMAHHEGAYLTEANTAVPLAENTGAWIFRRFSDSKQPDQLYSKNIIGTYRGLYELTMDKNKIVRLNKIPNTIDESLRFVEIDSINHCIWISHPYKGLYKILLSDKDSITSTKLYTDKNGLPSYLDNYVYKLNNRIIICTNAGIYRYDNAKDKFIPDETYKDVFKNMPLRTVVEDSDKNLWFVSGKKLGVVNHGRIQYFSEATGKMIKGFEFIYPFNRKNIFVGTTDGLLHINLDKYNAQNTVINAILNKVVASGNKDSILFNGFYNDGKNILSQQTKQQIPQVAPASNSFHFEFSNTAYNQTDYIEYAYQLVGFDKNWSAWSNKNEKDYTNLPYGEYTFRIKAKDDSGNESKIASYSFYLKPHWYQTNIARVFYLLLGLCCIYLIRQYQLRKLEKQKLKFEKEQEQLQYVHQLEKEHNEREIINLQKENLENQVSYKNKELASTTMHLYKRGKILSTLKDKLAVVVKDMSEDASRKEMLKLIRLLNDEEKRDSDWEQFSIHFDGVHNNFLINLKKTHPYLTQADLKICAYIKMNLSSKEIAQLLNISLKGVEVARYRLRKKLNIGSPTTSLYDALVSKN